MRGVRLGVCARESLKGRVKFWLQARRLPAQTGNRQARDACKL